MSHLRRINRLVTVLSLLVLLLVLTAVPAAAQDDEDDREPPITLVVLANVMTNEERENAKDEEWEVRVSLRPLSKCTPTVGHGTYDTPWIEAGTGAVAKLSLQECVYSIAAVARDASLEGDCMYPAQLGWARQPTDGNYVDNSLLSSSRPVGETTLSIRRKPDSPCLHQNRTDFVIRGSSIVTALPEDSADAELLALASRAAALTEFKVRVEPDPSLDAVHPPGCDRTTEFTVRGDGERVSAVLHEAIGSCPLRASIVDAPAPFESFEGSSVSFDGAGLNILVDVSRLVRLSPARIAIIQDVRGSNNRGAVAYTITRSCGDVSTSAPATREAISPLSEGRYTVHAPHVPTFGATATYPVGATSATSSSVAGCSVTVTMSGLPVGCSVTGGLVQTLTWSVTAPIDHFDFEFVVRCGAATELAPIEDPTAATETTIPATDMEPLTDDGPGADTGSPQQPTDVGGPPLDSPTG